MTQRLIPGNTWRPLVQGDAAARVRDVARQLARDLAKRAETDSADSTLGSGRCGLALLSTVLAGLETQDDDSYKQAEDHWTAALETMANTAARTGLLSGIAGVGWSTAFFEKHWLETDGTDLHEDLENALLARVKSPAASLDLTDGAVGYGVYGLERLPHPRAKKLVETCVRQLDRRALKIRSGITWFCEPADAPLGWQDEFPDGFYDLGLAHGIAGMIVFLSHCVERGIAVGTARRLAEGATRWLVTQDGRGESPFVYPSVVTKHGEPVGGRLAWCYGDLAVAWGLAKAACALDDRSLMHRARNLAQRTAQLAPDGEIIRNAGLCHGATGVALLFHCLAILTETKSLEAAARIWLDAALEMIDAQRQNREDPSLLLGDSGTALALLSLASPEPLGWDRCLLLSP